METPKGKAVNMTKLQSWMMTGLAIAALGVGVLLASGAISSAQEGSQTPTPSPSEESTDDESTLTPSPSEDSDESDDADTEDEEDEDTGEQRGCAGGGGKHLVKEAAAEVLGLSEEEVRGALGDGQSLAGLAEAQGMSVEDFRAALLSNITADLQAQLDAGEITQEEFDEITAELSENLDDIINSEGGFRFHHRFDDDEEAADGDETGAGFVPPFQRAPVGSGT